MNAIFHRTSIRKYDSRPVEQEKIEKMLRAAMAAPSACNQQPWEFYVVTVPEKLEALSKSSPYTGFTKNAAVAFVICTKTTDLVSPLYTEIDASAATENLLLEADALGLGCCWMGIAPIKERMDYVAGVIDCPDTLLPFAIVSCGYPAEERKQQDRYDEARVHYIR